MTTRETWEIVEVEGTNVVARVVAPDGDTTRRIVGASTLPRDIWPGAVLIRDTTQGVNFWRDEMRVDYDKSKVRPGWGSRLEARLMRLARQSGRGAESKWVAMSSEVGKSEVFTLLRSQLPPGYWKTGDYIIVRFYLNPDRTHKIESIERFKL